MRVSQYYKLGRTQESLDFVDVDLETDVPVFLSPRALDELPTAWGQECASSVQSFFGHILSLIREGRNSRAEALLKYLREPNETHLGLSQAEPAGRALGEGSAHDVWSALATSEAAKSGLINELEDTVLLVPGIGPDIVSDMTTNLIRGQLIEYTQHVCGYYGIEMKTGITSGPIWDPLKQRWDEHFVGLPRAGRYGKLLLVPKAIVRLGITLDGSEYYRHFLLERMVNEEEKENTSLVRLIKGGPRRGEYGVTKGDLIEKYGSGKEAVIEQTKRFPSVLGDYKATKLAEPFLPLSHEQFSTLEQQDQVDWDSLLEAVLALPVGRNDATAYENSIEALLTALFYPALVTPTKQDRIHEGRKRVDITYANMGVAGFFKWLQGSYPSAMMFIECKNYGKEIGNPEIDQLSGRFSPSRGKVGLLVCRSIADRALLAKRCRDTANDARGFIIALDDPDLRELVEERKKPGASMKYSLLHERFRALIL